MLPKYLNKIAMPNSIPLTSERLRKCDFASIVSQKGLFIIYTIENAIALYTSSHNTMTDDMWQSEHSAWIGRCDKPTGTMVAIG
jgi:hypothetical protein